MEAQYSNTAFNKLSISLHSEFRQYHGLMSIIMDLQVPSEYKKHPEKLNYTRMML